MMDVMTKVPVREQEAKVRATNFEEVCLGYNMEEAQCEASRCINCKNAQCVKGCPVAIDIPASVKASASVASRVIRSALVSWSVLWLTGQERMALSPQALLRRRVRKLQ